MICQYCNHTLKNKSSLNAHQKKTKYCLKIQGKLDKGKFICECGKDFYSKHHLTDHQGICSILNTTYVQELKRDLRKAEDNYKTTNAKLEEALRREKELMKEFAKLAAISANKSTTVTNNSTTHNNTLNLGVFDKSADDIKKIVDEKYDREYLVQGQLGVARFTHKHVLDGEDKEQNPVYLITDKNRGNGKYKISETEVVSDPNMNGLTKRVHPSIKSKAIYITSTHPNPLSDEDMMNGYREVYEMGENNTIFRKGMIKLLDE